MAKKKVKAGKLAERPCDGCGKEPDLMQQSWVSMFTLKEKETQDGEPYEILDEFICCAPSEDCNKKVLEKMKEVNKPTQKENKRKRYYSEWKEFNFAKG